MKKMIILILIVFLISGCDSSILVGLDLPEELVSEGDIAGNVKLDITEENSISREFGSISGNPEINIKTEKTNADIHLHFKGKISGNPTIDIKAEKGDIYVRFEESIMGASKINIESNYGNVIFVNEKSTIEEFKKTIDFDVRAGGEIKYKNPPL